MVRQIWITQDAERLITYIARVSNPKNQDNPDREKLLKYCLKESHWSPFEQAFVCYEIVTSRAITAQIIRHRSFCFQEWSQRYAKTQTIEPIELRRQDDKNRQNSIDDLPEETKQWFTEKWGRIQEDVQALYAEAIEKGIAKECARFILPMATQSKIYMTGSVRSWIHYINLRSGNGTQLEHQRIAIAIKEDLKKDLPIISSALGW